MPSKAQEAEPTRGFPGSSFKYTPLLHVRVLFTSFVQGLFRAAPAGAFHWDPNLENSEIVITDENPIKYEVMQMRPAITFTRGPIAFTSIGIDDMEDFDHRTDKKTKNVLVPGTMTINCLSRVDLEAEQIAWVIGEHIWLLRELFMKKGFFELGRGITIGSPSPAGTLVAGDSGDEVYAVPIQVPYQFPRQSAFTPLGKEIINSIEFEISTTLRKHASKGPVQTEHELPLSEDRCYPPSFAPDASDTYNRTPDPAGTRTYKQLPVQPHPLNPAAKVIVRSARPNQPGIRGPGMNGVELPIRDHCEGESEL